LGAVVLAGMYLFLAHPTYRSDVLLQVEDKTKGIAGLDDLSTMFSEKTPADTEIEIIRSRSLLGAIVDELNLTVEARPRTFPVFWGALYRRYDGDGVAAPIVRHVQLCLGRRAHRGPAPPGPDELLDEPLRLIAGDKKHFTIKGPKGETLVAGRRWKAATAGEGDARVEVFISELIARPGTQFRVTKRRRAGVIDDLQTELRISEKGKKTGILTVALDGMDGDQIARILDAIARTYVRRTSSARAPRQRRRSNSCRSSFRFSRRTSIRVRLRSRRSSEASSVDLTIETRPSWIAPWRSRRRFRSWI